MYLIIDIMIVSSGIMWIAASTSYIFPLLPFLLYIYLDQKKNKNMPILIFLAAFSQEQIGAAAICYTLVDYVLKWHKTRKINNDKLKPLIISTIGFTALMIAPGNFKRIEEAEFYNLSLITKLKTQSLNIIENIFYSRNTYFIKLILITSIILNNKNQIIKALNIVYLAFDIILINGYYDTLVNNNMYIVFIIHLIAIIITNIKKKYLLYLLPALASQGIMLLAPYYPSRSIIPFMFLYFIIIIDVIRKNKYFKYIMAFTLIVGISNFSYITYGYYQNKESNKYNHELLLKISKENKNGAHIKEAKLKKAKNNMFANTLPYEDPNLIYPYMRQYYNLDENFVFVYE